MQVERFNFRFSEITKEVEFNAEGSKTSHFFASIGTWKVRSLIFHIQNQHVVLAQHVILNSGFRPINFDDDEDDSDDDDNHSPVDDDDDDEDDNDSY